MSFGYKDAETERDYLEFKYSKSVQTGYTLLLIVSMILLPSLGVFYIVNNRNTASLPTLVCYGARFFGYGVLIFLAVAISVFFRCHAHPIVFEIDVGFAPILFVVFVRLLEIIGPLVDPTRTLLEDGQAFSFNRNLMITSLLLRLRPGVLIPACFLDGLILMGTIGIAICSPRHVFQSGSFDGRIITFAITGLAQDFLAWSFMYLTDGRSRRLFEKLQVLDQRKNEANERSLMLSKLMHDLLPDVIVRRLRWESEGTKNEEDSTTCCIVEVPRAIVLFADIVNFTKWSKSVSSRTVVRRLGDICCFVDTLVREKSFGLERLKTIGDALILFGERKSGLVIVQAVEIAVRMMRYAHQSFRSSFRVGIAASSESLSLCCFGGERRIHLDLFGNAVQMAEEREAVAGEDRICVGDECHSLLVENECAYSFQPHETMDGLWVHSVVHEVTEIQFNSLVSEVISVGESSHVVSRLSPSSNVTPVKKRKMVVRCVRENGIVCPFLFHVEFAKNIEYLKTIGLEGARIRLILYLLFFFFEMFVLSLSWVAALDYDAYISSPHPCICLASFFVHIVLFILTVIRTSRYEAERIFILSFILCVLVNVQLLVVVILGDLDLPRFELYSTLAFSGAFFFTSVPSIVRHYLAFFGFLLIVIKLWREWFCCTNASLSNLLSESQNDFFTPFLFSVGVIVSEGQGWKAFFAVENIVLEQKKIRTETRMCDRICNSIIPKAVSAYLLENDFRGFALRLPNRIVVFLKLELLRTTEETPPLRTSIWLPEFISLIQKIDTILEDDLGGTPIKTTDTTYIGLSSPVDSTFSMTRFLHSVTEIVCLVSENEFFGKCFVGLAFGNVGSGVVGHERQMFDIWGRVVNRSARILQLQEVGQEDDKILMTKKDAMRLTDSVHETFPFRDVGTQYLKGFGEVELVCLSSVKEEN